MTLIICPGIHDVALSDRFLAALNQQLTTIGSTLHIAEGQVFPSDREAPFNGLAVWSFLQEQANPAEPLVLIGFSAGVVGAIAAANLWQGQGRMVAAAIAVDGWGVPQVGDFPLYRVSHDYFTHWSSAVLGAGADSFYADPPVDHLDLWQFPDRAAGFWVSSSARGRPTTKATTAIAFIAAIICQYEGASPSDR
ncbi:hypothetical protein [Leptolyngbya iicbica]|uniref:Alpha/beta hydrolase n=2 Tax=Cyanophyceae TaxID=3028117 RepID=A0A4Q7E247_9CYAN|nr:hypothetical protein [Leptolyngbya sp. LK]RZM75237.1 hypothetical protein DYY88_21650 [Leptolyngbya sp. LK]